MAGLLFGAAPGMGMGGMVTELFQAFGPMGILVYILFKEVLKQKEKKRNGNSASKPPACSVGVERALVAVGQAMTNVDKVIATNAERTKAFEDNVDKRHDKQEEMMQDLEVSFAKLPGAIAANLAPLINKKDG